MKLRRAPLSQRPFVFASVIPMHQKEHVPLALMAHEFHEQ